LILRDLSQAIDPRFFNHYLEAVRRSGGRVTLLRLRVAVTASRMRFPAASRQGASVDCSPVLILRDLSQAIDPRFFNRYLQGGSQIRRLA
jgi:hypothetical protein